MAVQKSKKKSKKFFLKKHIIYIKSKQTPKVRLSNKLFDLL
jgi:hypothetical protein